MTYTIESALEAILIASDKPITADDVLPILRSTGIFDSDNTYATTDHENSYSVDDPIRYDEHTSVENQRQAQEHRLSSTHILYDDKTQRDYIEQAFMRLSAQYDADDRGFELYHGVSGWQLMSRQKYEQVVTHFIVDSQTARLSQAALETLAIIAYKQPITRAQVSAIRGVNSDGVIRSLSVRGLIREQGQEDISHASLLVTTGAFLDTLGINSLDQLPQLAPFLPDTLPDDDE